MTAEQLRNSILQEAISGRLVPQDPNDEPASALLTRIRDEKARLTKEGKLKKEKPSAPITEDEIPFEIPSSWEWVRFGDYMEIIGGYAFPSESLKAKEGPRVVRISDISEKGFVNKSIVRYKGNPISETYRISQFDILIAMTGGTVGKSLLVPELSEEMYLNQRVANIRNHWFDIRYVDTVIKAPQIKEIINERKNSTNDNISMVDIKNFLLPLPPLAEQKRIVAKLEELLPIVEQYGKAQKELDELNAALPARLRQSILQEAISGRLVQQNPNDELAAALLQRIREEKARLVKEGKLKKKDLVETPITDEEKPFEIPDNWEWCRITDILQINPKNKAEDSVDAAFIPMEKIKATYLSDFTYSVRKWREIKNGFTHFANGDVAFAKITPCFQNRKSMILRDLPNGIGAGTTELKVLRSYNGTINAYYLLFFLESAYFVEQAIFKGTANQQRIISGYLENKPFPLPPLAEQQRIVAKIEELFAEIDKIQANN